LHYLITLSDHTDSLKDIFRPEISCAWFASDIWWWTLF